MKLELVTTFGGKMPEKENLSPFEFLPKVFFLSLYFVIVLYQHHSTMAVVPSSSLTQKDKVALFSSFWGD